MKRRAIHLGSSALVALAVTFPAFAGDFTGTVNMLEVWDTGNVAFTLTPVAATCNQQFILNASSPGFKNLYAAVLAAKKTGTPIRVITSSCVPADGYGGSYNKPDYIYSLD